MVFYSSELFQLHFRLLFSCSSFCSCHSSYFSSRVSSCLSRKSATPRKGMSISFIANSPLSYLSFRTSTCSYSPLRYRSLNLAASLMKSSFEVKPQLFFNIFLTYLLQLFLLFLKSKLKGRTCDVSLDQAQISNFTARVHVCVTNQ